MMLKMNACYLLHARVIEHRPKYVGRYMNTNIYGVFGSNLNPPNTYFPTRLIIYRHHHSLVTYRDIHSVSASLCAATHRSAMA
eukprot:4754555-Pleurochrysis_carterae.AAC.3